MESNLKTLNCKIEEVAAIAMGVDSLIDRVGDMDEDEKSLFTALVFRLCDGCKELYKMS